MTIRASLVLAVLLLGACDRDHDTFERPTAAFLALVAALIGFSTLLTGGFSRFGLWRQIGLAVALLVVVQFLANGATSLVAQSPAAWPAIYLPVLAGLGLAAVSLWSAGRVRRPGRAAPANAGAVAT